MESKSQPDSPARIISIGGGNRAVKYLKYVLDNPGRAIVAGIVEPDTSRREDVARMFGIPEENVMASAEDFFSRQKMGDAVIIASPDVTHHDYAARALMAGYHVLLEKPIARSLEECTDICRIAEERGLIVSVCHVLRHHPYFKKIKEIIDSGELGKVVSISHRESVGVDRATHCYVRGSWRREDNASPMILTKFCHDADLMVWFTGSRMRHVASFGSLSWFKEENAPENSSRRCTDCMVENDCPYSAVDLYRNRKAWIDNFDMTGCESRGEAVEKELLHGPYGRCAFRCDNNVVDRQVIALEMENGVTVTLSMDLFTNDDNRTTHICLTHGEIYGDESHLEVTKFRSDSPMRRSPSYSDYNPVPAVCSGVRKPGHTGAETIVFDFSNTRRQPFHAWADHNIVEEFIRAVETDGGIKPVTGIADMIESHRICLEAEESRLCKSGS